MLHVRYEEYSQAVGQVPFVLNDHITRTPILFSEKQNWHENIEIQFCLEGSGTVLIDGKQFDFHKNDIAVIDSNSIHYTCSDSFIDYSCLIVGTDFCEQMGIDYHNLSFTPILQSEKLSDLFVKICDIYQTDAPLRIAQLHYLLLEMLIEIVANYSTVRNCSTADKKELRVVKSVLIYIRENYNHKITLDRIAKHSLTDKYTLCKVFKRITGQTVFENINAYRCMKASEYIAEGKSVSEAAGLCGFESNSFFTKVFKRYMGKLPSKVIV